MGIERISVSDFTSEFWEHHYRNSIPFVLHLELYSLPCLDWSIDSLRDLSQEEIYVLYEMPQVNWSYHGMI